MTFFFFYLTKECNHLRASHTQLERCLRTTTERTTTYARTAFAQFIYPFHPLPLSNGVDTKNLKCRHHLKNAICGERKECTAWESEAHVVHFDPTTDMCQVQEFPYRGVHVLLHIIIYSALMQMYAVSNISVLSPTHSSRARGTRFQWLRHLRR